MKRGGHVEVHGDAAQVAAGDFTVHNHFWTSGYPVEAVPETPWWELPSDELEEILSAERAEFWRAWRRYWFNIPCLLIAATVGGAIAMLATTILAGHSFDLFGGTGWGTPLTFIALVCFLTPTGVWMHRIRRIEGIAAGQAQENIDGLEAVLTRRRRLRR